MCRLGRVQRAPQARRRRRRRLVQGQGPADPGDGPLEGPQDVIGLDGCRLPGDPGGHERVAVPVGAHPAAEPEERGHLGRDAAAVRARDGVVHRAVERGHHPEQRLVERGHHRADLIDRIHGAGPELRRPPQHVDLLAQLAEGLGAVGRGEPGIIERVHQGGNQPQRGDHRPAPRLGGVSGEHRVHAQPGQQFLQPVTAVGAADLPHRGLQRLRQRVPGHVPLAQGPDALVLLGQVGEVEVHGEGAGDLLRAVQRPRGDESGNLVE